MTEHRVIVVDYDCGNLFSVAQALRHVGADPVLSSDPRDVASADRLVLPGVGAFGKAMEMLAAKGLDAAIREFATRQRPFLGICLGMQLMHEGSDEFGNHAGLALIPGRVRAIPGTSPGGHRIKVPHIGWRTLSPRQECGWGSTVLANHAPGFAMYFVHSFAAQPDDPAAVIAVSSYGGHDFCAAVQLGSLCGFQAHPEKSGEQGLAIFRRFAKI